ncbi:hypothetical protein V6N11_032118 [Hibiscus sabdariffa]|uniref:Uncharacterized protein n=1 Tax=Hibiscus sabdariffa TaxID=183260 RepID=A0ABR2SZP9_9ROSI
MAPDTSSEQVSTGSVPDIAHERTDLDSPTEGSSAHAQGNENTASDARLEATSTHDVPNDDTSHVEDTSPVVPSVPTLDHSDHSTGMQNATTEAAPNDEMVEVEVSALPASISNNDVRVDFALPVSISNNDVRVDSTSRVMPSAPLGPVN